MRTITKEREAAALTRFGLGSASRIHPARIGQIERGMAMPYPVELERLAAALSWTGDPADLLKDDADESPA